MSLWFSSQVRFREREVYLKRSCGNCAVPMFRFVIHCERAAQSPTKVSGCTLVVVGVHSPRRAATRAAPPLAVSEAGRGGLYVRRYAAAGLRPLSFQRQVDPHRARRAPAPAGGWRVGGKIGGDPPRAVAGTQ